MSSEVEVYKVELSRSSIRKTTRILSVVLKEPLLPRLFGTNPRSHHKGAIGRVRTGDQRLPLRILYAIANLD